MRYPALFPASDLVNHWAASADSLWLTPTSFSLITVGGRPLCLFIHPTTIENAVEFYSSFDINSILELCCWGTAFLQPSWPLSAWGYKLCVQHTSAGLHSWRTFAPVPSCLQSPSSLTLPANYQFPFEVQWHWVLTTEGFLFFFFLFVATELFSTPPLLLSFTLSLSLFLRSLISAQRQVGRFSRTLNESLWTCSCLFDLRFSLLKSGPRYQQRDVTSARARSHAARSECSLACAHQPKSY